MEIYTLDSIVHGRRIGNLPKRYAEQALIALNSKQEWWLAGEWKAKEGQEGPPNEDDVVRHFCDPIVGGARQFREAELQTA